MRKIYFGFVAIFAILIALDVYFSPDPHQVNTQLASENEISEPLQIASLLPSDAASLPSEEDIWQSTKPDTLSWKLLGQIKFVQKPHPDYPEGVMFPVINSTLKTKGKKKIVMSGFIIPIDNTSYALSKNVFASCFFCGGAGPETIMGIQFKGATPRLKTDQYVTLEGTFRYNDDNVEDWIYHIENAVIVKGK
jgi:hypothetical protein